MIIDITNKCAVVTLTPRIPCKREWKVIPLSLYSKKALLGELFKIRKYLFECNSIDDQSKIHIYKLIMSINEELQNRENRKGTE